MTETKKSCPSADSTVEEYEGVYLTMESPAVDFPSNRQHRVVCYDVCLFKVRISRVLPHRVEHFPPDCAPTGASQPLISHGCQTTKQIRLKQ